MALTAGVWRWGFFMTWDTVWALLVSLGTSVWVFVTSGWDAAKIITAIGGTVTILSASYGLYTKWRTSGRRLVARVLEFIEKREQRLVDTRTMLENIATRPSPGHANGVLFPREVLDRSLVRMKWGKARTAAADILQAVTLAKQRAEMAEAHAREQQKEQALAHLMLGAIAASRESNDDAELAEARATALGEFDKALAIDPDDRDALQYAGLMLLQMANAAGALDRFNQLLELTTKTDDKLKLARAYRLQASAFCKLPVPSLGNASNALNAALAAYPQDAPPMELASANEQLGDIRFQLGRNNVANQSYQRALTIYYVHRTMSEAGAGILRVTGKIADLNTAQSPTPPTGGASNGNGAVAMLPPPSPLLQ